MASSVHAPKGRASAAKAPRALRWCVAALEVGLVVLLAYQLSSFFLNAGTPALTPEGDLPASRASASRADLSRLQAFDPFFRQIASVEEEASTSRAPESTLKLELFGLRTTGNGEGSAIVKMQDGEQKLVQVGERIANGVTLVGVYADRIEVSRAGSREAVYLRPSAERTAGEAAPRRPAPAPQRAPAQDDGFMASLAGLGLQPVRRDNHIVGFQLPDRIPAVIEAVGLEGGDILLAAGGTPMSSYERIREIGEELAGASSIELEIERRGETRRLSVGLRGNR